MSKGSMPTWEGVGVERLFSGKHNLFGQSTHLKKWEAHLQHARIFLDSEISQGVVGLSDDLDGKESACNAGDTCSIPGWGRSPGGGNSNPLQYSCLENSMDRGSWWATVHGVPKNQTQLSNYTHTHTHTQSWVIPLIWGSLRYLGWGGILQGIAVCLICWKRCRGMLRRGTGRGGKASTG